MAKRTEEVVLDLSIEQKDSLSELESLKKGIISLKEQQQQLTKSYKSGQLTLQEYAKETTFLDSKLKLQTSQYNRVQKSVTGVKSEMDKLIASNKQLSSTTGDAIKQMNVAGVSVGGLTTKLQSFLNPATAAVGVTGLLFSAYAKSTIGAKDLDFAQNQLAASTSLLTNRFAALISSGKDGEGFFSRLTNAALNFISPVLAAESKFLAQLSENLEDLGREEIQIRSTISDRLSDNQDKMTKIADAQTTYNQKVKLGAEIVENLQKNQDELVKNLKDQLYTIIAQLALDAENEDLLTKKLEKEREINKLIADSEKKLQGQVRANDNILESERKRAKQLSDDSVTGGKKMTLILPKEEEADALEKAKEFADMLIQVTSEMGGQEVAIHQQTADEKKAADEDVARNKRRLNKEEMDVELATSQAKLQLYASVTSSLASMARQGSTAQKAFALVSIGFDSAAALIGGIRAAQNLGFPANLAAMALTTATILGNIQSAKKLIGGKAAGGGDFVTSGPAILMVGDNPGGRERVTVEPISGRGQTQIYPHSGIVAMAGGGSMTTGGASIAHSITTPINMSFKGNQMPKQMFVSWAEGKQMDRMVAFKEKLTTV